MNWSAVTQPIKGYSQTSTNSHLCTTATLFCPGGDSPYIGFNLNVSTTATATKACSQLPTSRQRPVFSVADEKVKNGHEI